jgi:hypothetical protein
VTVDCAVIDINLIVISGIHQGVAIFENTWTLRKRLQNQEFSDRKRDTLAALSRKNALIVEPISRTWRTSWSY